MAQLNIANIVERYVNHPKIKNTDMVLYTKSENYSGELSIQDKKIKDSENLKKISLLNYSSPNNVRRLFVTGNRVVLQTYKPMMKYGSPDTQGCWYEYKYEEADNLRKRVFTALEAQAKVQAGKSNEKYEQIVGKIYRIIHKPWVLSNIEEIYVDWTVLASEDLIARHPDVKMLIQSALKQEVKGKVDTNVLQGIFEEEVRSVDYVGGLRDRFPRLKSLVYIANLDEILEGHYDRGKPNEDAYTEYGKMWYELPDNADMIKAVGQTIVISDLSGNLSRLNREFALRDGIYKFDDEVLKGFFNSLVDLIKRKTKELADTLREKEAGVSGVSVSEVAKIQNLLEVMENEIGVGKTTLVMRLALLRADKEYSQKMIAKLDEKYKQYIPQEWLQ